MNQPSRVQVHFLSPPSQLIVLTLIEIVLFVGNEVIGRKGLGAVDAGDTIFVHLFGAYFGLAVSRVLHYKNADHHKNQASKRGLLYQLCMILCFISYTVFRLDGARIYGSFWLYGPFLDGSNKVPIYRSPRLQ